MYMIHSRSYSFLFTLIVMIRIIIVFIATFHH